MNMQFENLFTKKELKTLKIVKLKYVCDCCDKNASHLNQLADCTKKMKICSECLENFFDNYNSSMNELFICPCCNKKIKNYHAIY